ncbi:MAG TPA: gas vesicle protein GvpJ [Acidimicrobiales bacterium]|nr:gas vesicle protein GvpJ [Acidimicrobiales bacterium]
MSSSGSAITRAPRPSSLADVLDLILDKGLVIDAYVRVSLVGIELLTIDARVVIASVDTYLHYAEAVNRLDLKATETAGIPALFGQDDGGGQGGDDQDDEGAADGHKEPARQLSGSAKRGGASDGDEGKSGRSLAGRLGERGRWDR